MARDRSEAAFRLWLDPEYRRKQMEARRKTAYRRRIAAITKRFWTAENRKAHSEKMKRAHRDNPSWQ